MPLSFQQQVNIEQLRALEQLEPPLPQGNNLSAIGNLSFEDWLWRRFQLRCQSPKTQALIQQAPNHYRTYVGALVMVFLLLGFASVGGLVSAEQEKVNTFWLLGVLLGANTMTLLLWLLFVALLGSHSQGIIASLQSWGLSLLYRPSANPSPPRAINNTWWHSTFSYRLRTWRLGTLTHTAWLCFLIGSGCGLLVLFTTQQYDFVWESTLMDEHQFRAIFNTLGKPLAVIGISPPQWDVSSGELSAQLHRQQWAWFVLACMVIYALLPRAIVLSIAMAVLYRRQQQWKIDFSEPYYVQLHQHYNRQYQHIDILDAAPTSTAVKQPTRTFSNQLPPPEAPWMGLEVDPQRPWQSLVPRYTGLLNTQSDVGRFAQQQARPSVIFVEAQRPPDRGLKRHLHTLQDESIWFAVISTSATSTEQLQAWLSAAAEADFKPEKCILLKVET